MRYTFTVIVTDAGGVLEAEIIDHGGNVLTDDYAVEFNNTHHVAPVVVDVQKYIDDTTENSAITAAGFTVIATVADAQWAPTNETHTEVTDGAGQIRFAGNYERAGEHYYIVKEQVDAVRVAAGWEYDPTVYYLKVVVTQQASGDLTAQQFVGTSPDSLVTTADVELAFTNTYDPEDAQVGLDVVPAVLKRLENKTLAAGDFTFYVTEDGNHSNIYLTGTNDADGKVIFGDKLSFKAIGEYKFDIIEKQENTPGVTYDKTVYDLVVEVSDKGDGTLKAIYYFEDSVTDQVAFHNVYSIENGQLVIDGTKNLTGRPMLNAEFRFTLTQVTDESGTTAMQNGLALQAANRPDNDHNGKAEFAFPAITYTAADVGNTYYYLVREQNAGQTINGITYSTREYRLSVEVKDNGVGGIVAEIAGSGLTVNGETAQGLDFTNTYTAAPVDYFPEAQKVYEGDTMKTFDFVLSGNGFATQTKQNDAQGKVVFDKLTFVEAGTYTFTVKEKENALWGFIKWDTNKYELVIEVTDNGMGQLEIGNVTITSTKGRDDLVFRNVHEDLITKKDVALESKPNISIDGQTVRVGDVLVYTITYTNYTGVAVDEVTITDTIPQYTEFVVGSAGEGVLAGNQLSWKFTNVAADAVINVSFKVKVAEGGVTVTNEAAVLEGTNTYESNEVTNQVEKKDPKLTIVKQQAVGSDKATAEKLDAEIGSTVTYFLTVTNSGEGEAKGITVSDKIPEGLVYVAGSADNSGTLESGVLTWKIPSLAPGQSIQLQFKVKIPTVTKDTSWTNVATMVSENDPETVESNEVVVTAKIPVTPDTGDNFSATLFIALMVLSSFGIAAIMVCKKHEEEKTAQ